MLAWILVWTNVTIFARKMMQGLSWFGVCVHEMGLRRRMWSSIWDLFPNAYSWGRQALVLVFFRTCTFHHHVHRTQLDSRQWTGIPSFWNILNSYHVVHVISYPIPRRNWILAVNEFPELKFTFSETVQLAPSGSCSSESKRHAMGHISRVNICLITMSLQLIFLPPCALTSKFATLDFVQLLFRLAFFFESHRPNISH